MINKWREMSPKRQRSIVLGVLISIMLLMVVGYAAFSSMLNITGTSNISSNWNIRITNITSSLHGATNAIEPTYDNENGLTASFSTNLVSPGDYAEYTVTVRNNGDIDATLTNIEISDSNNPAIVFETSGLEEGDNLLKQTEDELIVKVSYNESVESQPENVTSNITVTLTYEQAIGGNTPEEGTAGSDLVEIAGTVTSGDGLYADSYEENVYTYRGANPNNYVTFNGESWRIISVNTSDNTIKIMKIASLGNRAFDTSSNGRQDNQYCDDSYCNIYGSTSTLYDSNLSPITKLAREVGGTAYQLPSKESEISTYLNGTYYNGLSELARNMIVDGIYKAGPINYQEENSLAEEIGYAKRALWKGKIALADATEFIRASTNINCTNMHSTVNASNSCELENWMYKGGSWWTMSPEAVSERSITVWLVYNNGLYGAGFAVMTENIYPVVTLKPDIQIISGDGSENNAYQLSIES